MKPEEKQRALEWLNLKWQHKKCECCGQFNWQLEEELYTIIPLKGKSLVLGGVQMPSFIYLMCKNCGNTKLFNAIMSGIVEKNTSNLPNNQ